ncbi:MAG: NAD(P)-dependent oxidoreductase [Bacteroidota bacterium]
MNVLIIDPYHESLLEELDKLPVSYTYEPALSREEILKRLPEAEILIMNSRINIDKEAADAAPKLKLLIRGAVGMDHIDMEYLASKGVRAQNCPEVNADSVGEQSVAMLLALRHHLHRANQQVKNFIWSREENRGHEMGKKTLGIIGYGNTGKATARKISGFGARVIAYDKYLQNYGDEYAEAVGMEEIFWEADALSLHIPLTDETHHLANADFFNSFAKPIYFLNLARGPITNLEDLMKAIDAEKVIAAAIDVLPNENFKKLSEKEKDLYSRLFAYENIIFSPHIGGWSVESRRNTVDRIIGHVKEVL